MIAEAGGTGHVLEKEEDVESIGAMKKVGIVIQSTLIAEKAGRVADFLEFAEVFAEDALTREESCGGHFREEHQTEEGEARRDDEQFAHATAWEYKGDPKDSVPHKEQLTFDYVKLTQRSYK